MLQHRLHVTIPFKDDALSLIFVEVQLVLQRSGIFRSHHLHTLRCNTLELLKLAIMNLQSGDTLDLSHWCKSPTSIEFPAICAVVSMGRYGLACARKGLPGDCEARRLRERAAHRRSGSTERRQPT